MPSIYRIAKSAYQIIVPVRRRGPLHDERTLCGRVFMGLLRRLERFGRHDEIYDRDYYERIVDEGAVRSSAAIADSIMSRYQPGSVMDVGCGTGALLLALKRRGVAVSGLEHASAALDWCKSRGLDVCEFDLEKPATVNKRADVAVSTEVAEHLPAECADVYVNLLTSIAPVVIITAAPPGQGGHDHVNEQPPEYWIEKFERRSFRLDVTARDEFRAAWRSADVVKCYTENLLIFERRG